MLIKVEPIYKALAGLLGENKVKRIKKNQKSKDTKIILLTPRGKLFNQKMAKSFTKSKNIVFICGHYEGVDERVKHLITDDVSIGDYILTGGEIPAMVVLDAITRLIPGVLGDSSSLKHESFEDNLLEYPQYTRPREFEGMMVPEVLLSGNHKKIEKWRKKQSLKKTKEVRSDLCTR